LASRQSPRRPDLLEQRFGLGLGFGIGLGRAAGELDEDVAGAGLLGNLILGLVGVVVGLDLLSVAWGAPPGIWSAVKAK
jgi:uncharacterized membrane protein YeaQ/YmgE (transglycosylase-associated protein family)